MPRPPLSPQNTQEHWLSSMCKTTGNPPNKKKIDALLSKDQHKLSWAKGWEKSKALKLNARPLGVGEGIKKRRF